MKTQENKAEKIAQAKQSDALSVRQAPAGEVLQAYSEGRLHRSAASPVASFGGNSATNHTGMPDRLKSGMERLSGYSLDSVRVHYNSDKPTQLQSLAYTQGTDIHIAPGQEQHLPHEAWHVVQQMQGRVQPTCQLKGTAVNDDSGLEQEADRYGRMAVAEGTMTGTTSAAPTQLRSAAGRPVAQMFRLVQPHGGFSAIGTPYFSTHKVVHMRGNDSPQDLVNTSVSPDYLRDVDLIASCTATCEQIITELNGICTMNQQTDARLEVVNRTYAVFTAEIVAFIGRSPLGNDLHNEIGSVDRCISDLSTYISGYIFTHNDVLLFVFDVQKSYERLLKKLYVVYFNASGRLSDPQRPNEQFGSERYETIAATENSLSSDSRFGVRFVTTYSPYPMLVSENTHFAINAAYPEPKEVYMTREVALQINTRLDNSSNIQNHWALFPDAASVRIGNTFLYKYVPVFNVRSQGNTAQGNYSPETSDCGEFLRGYYPFIDTTRLHEQPVNARVALANAIAFNNENGMRSGQGLWDNSRTPWNTHVAGRLYQDGADCLSLENGARRSWITNRGMAKNRAIGNQLEHDGNFDQMMKDTWYFRIYGPQELGQDITQQTKARFGQ